MTESFPFYAFHAPRLALSTLQPATLAVPVWIGSYWLAMRQGLVSAFRAGRTASQARIAAATTATMLTCVWLTIDPVASFGWIVVIMLLLVPLARLGGPRAVVMSAGLIILAHLVRVIVRILAEYGR